MTCNECPYNGDCQIWFANGVPFSCKGIREGIMDDVTEATKTDNKKKYSSGYPYPSETATSYSKTMEASV